ncbi:copper amine oxidase N-terminal domain-containing protein [Tepidibacter aestuarii]|uniref:copper amine oxidase N-terminal domain-containing protein n=1 Tax=Tepidibacter aestuarii TaxID=2925782 RepID=UPI0020C15CF0|nr:copper amine oxidase N-terminal domain-containing protein [Tepidibacter aestuarii]
MKLLQKKIIPALLVSAIVFTGPAAMSANAQEKGHQNYKNNQKYEQMRNIKHEKTNIEKMKFDKEKIEKEIIKAKEDKNDKLSNELLKKIEELQNSIDKLTKDIKDLKRQMKKMAKEKYTQEELEKIEKSSNEIKENNENTYVLPVESIISEDLNMKFDTPPVIKYGRTLVPVRAISEGLGADVKWNAEEKKVIITKDDSEIILSLEDGKAYVNGEEKEIDVPAEIMCNRTIVPLRFIAENLGLDVDYDKETETIELEESTEDQAQDDQAQDDQAQDDQAQDDQAQDDQAQDDQAQDDQAQDDQAQDDQAQDDQAQDDQAQE